MDSKKMKKISDKYHTLENRYKRLMEYIDECASRGYYNCRYYLNAHIIEDDLMKKILDNGFSVEIKRNDYSPYYEISWEEI